jgi:hypothetical protein
MAQYKVKVLQVQGINKKIYNAGTIVSDQNFPEGVALELLKSGHLGELSKDESAKFQKANAAKNKALKEAQAVVEDAQAALDKASDEEKEDAQVALDIANENLAKLQ